MEVRLSRRGEVPGAAQRRCCRLAVLLEVGPELPQRAVAWNAISRTVNVAVSSLQPRPLPLWLKPAMPSLNG